MPKANRTTARGIVIHNHAVLLMERWRRNPQTGEQLHYFSIPGGGIRAGESPEAAVIRELHEETSLHIQPQALITQVCDQNGDAHYYFLCNYTAGEPALSPNSPEAKRDNAHNRHLPRWVSAAEFASAPLHPIYQPLHARICELL